MIIKKPIVIKYFFFFIIFIWCAGIFSEFLISQFPFLTRFLPFLKYNYSIVCHTESDKLLSIGMHQTLTCSRCTGIYLGAMLSSLLTLFGFKGIISTQALLFSSVPMFIDVVLYSSGVYNYFPIIALVTGLLLGSVGFLYIQNLVLELLFNFKGTN